MSQSSDLEKKSGKDLPAIRFLQAKKSARANLSWQCSQIRRKNKTEKSLRTCSPLNGAEIVTRKKMQQKHINVFDNRKTQRMNRFDYERK